MQSGKHIIYKRSASLLSSLEQSLAAELEMLNQEENEVEFCDVSESVDSSQTSLKSSGIFLCQLSSTMMCSFRLRLFYFKN